MNSHSFPQRLRLEIDKKFKNVAEIAKATGLNPTTIGYYLKDKSLPRSEEMLKLSRALGVSMEYLLTGEDSKPQDSAANEWKARALAAEAKLAKLSALLGTQLPAEAPKKVSRSVKSHIEKREIAA
jgi:transcriptional regulator with XRE-family HTH domain